MQFWMIYIFQFNTTNNTLPHQRIPAIDAERYCCFELYEHQCGILFFSNTDSNFAQYTLISYKKIPNT